MANQRKACYFLESENRRLHKKDKKVSDERRGGGVNLIKLVLI